MSSFAVVAFGAPRGLSFSAFAVFGYWLTMSIEEAAKILGVSPHESIDVVKEKYRKLARFFHPDHQASADLKELGEAKLKEVNLAFEVFKNRIDGPIPRPNSNNANSQQADSYPPNNDDEEFEDEEFDDEEFNDDVGSLEINQFWREVESVPPPPSVYERVNQTPHVAAAGSPLPPSAMLELRPSIERSIVQSLAGGSAVIALTMTLTSSAWLFGINIFVVFSVWWCICEWIATRQFETNNQPWLNARNALIREHALRDNFVRDLRYQLQYAEQQIQTSIAEIAKSFDDCRSRLEADKSNFHALDFAYRNARERTESVKCESQLLEFLDSHYIRDFKLDGIGPRRLAQLESMGITTVADVDAEVLVEIPGFGIGLIETLLMFRSVVVERFRFNPRAPLPAFWKALLNEKLAARRSQEVRLQTGFSNLRAASLEGKQRMKASKVQIQSLLSRLAQAEANAAVSQNALKSADALRFGNPLSQNAVVIFRSCRDVAWIVAEKTKSIFCRLMKP